MKLSLDEDVFLNSYIWDFMIENCDILDDEKNLHAELKTLYSNNYQINKILFLQGEIFRPFLI